MSHGGKREGSGPKKGSKHKQTVAVKQCLINAFEGMGGWQNLEKWGGENQSDFYKLWAKMLPTQVTGEDGGDITVTIKKIVHSAGD
jgi:hypothetical protein